tara:strand:+ start:305 stop:418 length:114 start_codon:yes stop_codon:yes gene_type:complete
MLFLDQQHHLMELQDQAQEDILLEEVEVVINHQHQAQ